MKNFSERRFDVISGFHMCQRFCRKIKKISPNFAKFLVGRKIFVKSFCVICIVTGTVRLDFSNCSTKCSHPPKIWRKLAKIFYFCDKIFDTYETQRYRQLNRRSELFFAKNVDYTFISLVLFLGVRRTVT